jgi:DNA polymerase III sliding clamp (beta) subunit (PCNA family)
MNTDTVMRSDTLTINAADLIAAIKWAATYADKSIPALTAIKFNPVAGGLELVATDRFRLGVATIAGVDTGALAEPILVPAAELAKWATGLKPVDTYALPDTIEIELDLGLIPTARFTYFGSSTTIKLLDATYPDYTKLAIDPAAYTGGASSIGFNPKLLAEINAAYAKVLGKNKPVSMHLPAESNRPILFTAATDSVSYLSLLMPMRVS